MGAWSFANVRSALIASVPFSGGSRFQFRDGLLPRRHALVVHVEHAALAAASTAIARIGQLGRRGQRLGHYRALPGKGVGAFLRLRLSITILLC